MVRSELILRIAEMNPHLYEKDVEAVVSAILGRITDALVLGERVELRGFGAFTVKTRDAWEGRNPKTGAAVSIAAKKNVGFKPGKLMQACLKEREPGTTPVSEHNTQWQTRWLGRGPSVRKLPR